MQVFSIKALFNENRGVCHQTIIERISLKSISLEENKDIIGHFKLGLEGSFYKVIGVSEIYI